MGHGSTQKVKSMLAKTPFVKGEYEETKDDKPFKTNKSLLTKSFPRRISLYRHTQTF